MDSVSRTRGRGRELAVLAAGFAAGAALLWAGTTVHEGLRMAGEVAVARLAGAAADTVVAEWERMLRASEPPVAPSGEVFHGSSDEPVGVGPDEESSVVAAATELREPSVSETLLREAERQEVVEHDLEAALVLVLEALEKSSQEALIREASLRAVQLGARLGRNDVVEENWERLRALELRDGSIAVRDEAIPARILAWLGLPDELKATTPSETILTALELETLLQSEDRLAFGPPRAPEARFELAPMLVVLLERLGLDAPPLERRKLAALARAAGPLPRDMAEGRWLPLELAGRSFFARRDGEGWAGFFYARAALEEALRSRSGLPEGFALDFAGDDESLGPAVRPRTELDGSPHAFTLRHADPGRIARDESSRLKLLRGALLVLAMACAAGGWLTARVLARERRLGELKSAFIAGVSHDLRTPLASILLLAENLESGAAEQSGRARYHDALRKEAARLRRRIDDVLDFSRLERGQATRLEREELALAPFVQELADDCRARVEAAGRPFALEWDEGGVAPATGVLDAHAVRRALENLVDNALKHGAGAVRLSVSCAGGRLRIALADEGPGVPAAERERVFEPFERLSAGNGHAGGTGLGLAIVRAIARAHGGEARVRSGADGAGAVFELDLPLVESEDGVA